MEERQCPNSPLARPGAGMLAPWAPLLPPPPLLTEAPLCVLWESAWHRATLQPRAHARASPMGAARGPSAPGICEPDAEGQACPTEPLQGQPSALSQPVSRGARPALTFTMEMAIRAADTEKSIAGSSMITAAPTLVPKNPTAASQPLWGDSTLSRTAWGPGRPHGDAEVGGLKSHLRLGCWLLPPHMCGSEPR